MIIVGVALCANEADIAEIFVRHNLRYLDRLLVGVHNALDGTAEILERLGREGLALELLRLDAPSFEQGRWTTRLARRAIATHGADWVLPLDFDEFIDVGDRPQLVAALAALATADSHGVWPWKTHVVTAADDAAEPNPLRRLRHRYAEPADAGFDRWTHKVLINAARMQHDGDEITTGNHFLVRPGGDEPSPAPHRLLAGAALRHYPIRSPAQAATKAALGYLARCTAGEAPGIQIREFFARLKRDGEFTVGDLAAMTRHYAAGNLFASAPQPIVLDPFDPALPAMAGSTAAPATDRPLPLLLAWIEKRLRAESTAGERGLPAFLAEHAEFSAGRSPAWRDYEDKPRLDLPFERIAFYLPQFHRCAENDRFWGEGFTDWNNVARALPRFAGHYQPRRPAGLGYYDLLAAHVLPRQVDLARNYGLTGFNFLFYWFGEKSVLEAPLRRFLDSPELDFGFFLTWANENWTRRWDGRDDEVLLRQDYSPAAAARLIRHLLPYFADRRYRRAGGRPILAVYRPDLIPDLAAYRRIWAEVCAAEGVAAPYLVMALTDGNPDPRAIGFDAALEYPPHARSQPRDKYPVDLRERLRWFDGQAKGAVCHYEAMVDSQLSVWPQPFRTFRTAFPAWDNSARRPNGGYWICAGSTPEKFGQWLGALGREEMAVADDFRMVCINAWNEWAEGAYLEPDAYFGYAYLDALHAALAGCARPAGG